MVFFSYRFSSCLNMCDSPFELTLVVNVKACACHDWSSKAMVFGHGWSQNQCQQNSGTDRVFQLQIWKRPIAGPFGGRVSAAPSRARYPSKSLAESCPAKDFLWQKFLGFKHDFWELATWIWILSIRELYIKDGSISVFSLRVSRVQSDEFLRIHQRWNKLPSCKLTMVIENPPFYGRKIHLQIVSIFQPAMLVYLDVPGSY